MLSGLWNWLRRDVGRPFLAVGSDDGMEFLRYKGGAIKGLFLLAPEAMNALEKRGEKLRSDYRITRRKLVDQQQMELNALAKKHTDALQELERAQRRRIMGLFAEYVAWSAPAVGKAA